MRKAIAKLGRLKVVALITIYSIIGSIIVAATIIFLTPASGAAANISSALLTAISVPCFIALPVIWYLVGQIISIHHLEEKMRSLATYDSLTGLLSRQAFMENAGKHLSLASREQKVFSVVLVDLDHFKRINDQYGHAAGDTVLKLFADVSQSVSRKSDILGRLGGEEFVFILPSTGIAEAIEFSERLHYAIRQSVLTYKGHTIKFTASIGLTIFDPDSVKDLAELIQQADQALYIAKECGRNQTFVYDDEHPDSTAFAG